MTNGSSGSSNEAVPDINCNNLGVKEGIGEGLNLEARQVPGGLLGT